MSISCEELTETLSAFSLARACDTIANGALRVATAFQYPDGSYIDLYVVNEARLFGPTLTLSDLGGTTAFLLDVQIKPWATKKRQRIVDSICASYGVEQVGGEFRTTVGDSQPGVLADALFRLGQVCIRVADLIFTQRLRVPSTFREEIEECLAESDLDYDTRAIVPGRFGRDVECHFRVRGRATTSLLLTLSTGNAAAGHALVAEVTTRWFDLGEPPDGQEHVTVFDSRNDIFRDDDLARLDVLSKVISYPAETDTLISMLAA